MLALHPRRELLAYREGALAPERKRKVEEHLSRCGRCRSELQEIAFAARLMGELPSTAAPESLYASIEQALAPAAARAAQPTRARRWAPAALGAAVALLMAVAWYFVLRQPLRAGFAAGPVSPLETAAMAEHRMHVAGVPGWEFQSADDRAVQRWLREASGLSAHLPDRRPSEDVEHLRLRGARRLALGSAAAVAIGYEIDGIPVTLATAHAADVAGAPAEAAFSKNVRYRADDADGYGVLTWSTEGQAYAMVSALPGYGQQGCFVCHTQPERRALIRRFNPR